MTIDFEEVHRKVGHHFAEVREEGSSWVFVRYDGWMVVVDYTSVRADYTWAWKRGLGPRWKEEHGGDNGSAARLVRFLGR